MTTTRSDPRPDAEALKSIAFALKFDAVDLAENRRGVLSPKQARERKIVGALSGVFGLALGGFGAWLVAQSVGWWAWVPVAMGVSGLIHAVIRLTEKSDVPVRFVDGEVQCLLLGWGKGKYWKTKVGDTELDDIGFFRQSVAGYRLRVYYVQRAGERKIVSAEPIA